MEEAVARFNGKKNKNMSSLKKELFQVGRVGKKIYDEGADKQCMLSPIIYFVGGRVSEI